MMFGLGSFNLINEFKRASNKLNVEQLASSSARLQPYLSGQSIAEGRNSQMRKRTQDSYELIEETNLLLNRLCW